MAFLLSLETATNVCSAALHEDGKLVASAFLPTEHSASSQLAVMAHDLLKHGGVKSSQLSGVGVSAGPGSYTGLRIGTATAKGICMALNIPLYSVNTLELMVHQVNDTLENDKELILCPMLDARRMEVYCLLADREGTVLERTQAKVIDETSFAETLERGKVLFFGNGSGKCRSVIRHVNALFKEDVVPMAREMGSLIYKKHAMSSSESLAEFEPLYLKDFVIKKPNVRV